MKTVEKIAEVEIIMGKDKKYESIKVFICTCYFKSKVLDKTIVEG